MGGYWTGKAFSKQGKSKAKAATPTPKKVKVEKCRCGSGKSALVCEHKTPTPKNARGGKLEGNTKKLVKGDKPVHSVAPQSQPGTCSCGAYTYANGTCRDIQCGQHKRNR